LLVLLGYLVKISVNVNPFSRCETGNLLGVSIPYREKSPEGPMFFLWQKKAPAPGTARRWVVVHFALALITSPANKSRAK